MSNCHIFSCFPIDAAYIESQSADQPFFICTIQEFRRVTNNFDPFVLFVFSRFEQLSYKSYYQNCTLFIAITLRIACAHKTFNSHFPWESMILKCLLLKRMCARVINAGKLRFVGRMDGIAKEGRVRFATNRWRCRSWINERCSLSAEHSQFVFFCVCYACEGFVLTRQGRKRRRGLLVVATGAAPYSQHPPFFPPVARPVLRQTWRPPSCDHIHTLQHQCKTKTNPQNSFGWWCVLFLVQH